MKKRTGFYPRPAVDAHGGSAVGQAGGVLLTSTIRTTGLDVLLHEGLAPWRSPYATHDPAKVLLDLAMTLALGGDTCSDMAGVRAEPAVYGPVASDPTLSRTITRLAGDADKALAAIDKARAGARAKVWKAAGIHAPDHGRSAAHPLVIDLDATLVTAHSEKENAAPTFKRGFGFHPLCAFVDHGTEGTGEPAAILLRAGNAGSNIATDHMKVIADSLAQIPRKHTRQVDPGAHRRCRRLAQGHRSPHDQAPGLLPRERGHPRVGFTLPENTPDLLKLIPEKVWAPALDAHDTIRDGAWVAELTDVMDLSSWPNGMRGDRA